MPRVRRGAARRQSKKRTLKEARGYRGGRSKLWRTAKEAVLRAGATGLVGRRIKKRDFRAMWITRISAACGQRGMNYSRLMFGLRNANVALNRKMLSEVAIHDPEAFDAIAELARQKAEQAA